MPGSVRAGLERTARASCFQSWNLDRPSSKDSINWALEDSAVVKQDKTATTRAASERIPNKERLGPRATSSATGPKGLGVDFLQQNPKSKWRARNILRIRGEIYANPACIKSCNLAPDRYLLTFRNSLCGLGKLSQSRDIF
jgi:hypothetical protein